MPVLGRREVGGRRAGGVVMVAPQIGDGPPPQTTDRERILPVMRYLTWLFVHHMRAQLSTYAGPSRSGRFRVFQLQVIGGGDGI